MKILSLNVGTPKIVEWDGKKIETAMQKKPVPGPLKVFKTHIEGDRHREPMHGGPDNIVYMLSTTIFKDWEQFLGRKIEAGDFGENLSIDSFHEKDVFLGDIYSVGTCELRATFPRIPCSKLNYCFQNANTQLQFVRMQRPGVYLQVVRDGEIPAHSELRLAERIQNEFSIADLYKMVTEVRFESRRPDRFDRLMEQPYLATTVRGLLEKYSRNLGPRA